MTHNGKTTAKTRRVSLSSVSVQSSDDSSSSLSDLSDDNGYSDLDNISDDEADEDDEEVSAMEMAYIQDEIPVTPSKSVTDHQSVADDADAEDGDNSTIASNLFWDQDIDVEEDTTATPHRQVRFDIPDSPSSSSATEDDDDGMFPDIFVPRSQLDPSFRREVDRDPDMWSNGSADLYDNLPYDSQTEDYYTDLQDGDINDMMTEAAFADFDMSAAVNSGTFDFDDDDGSSPGGIEISCGGDDILYLGDSTDDDEDPEPTPRKSRASPSPEDEETDLEIVEHNGVRLGSFRVQPTGRKPIVFRDPRTGEKVIKYPHELSMDQSAQTSMLGSPANLMLSGALPSMDMGGVALGQALFPLAALFPMNFGDMNDSDLSSPIEGSMGLDENGTDGGTEAHETMLNEFVNLEDEGAKEESGAANTDCYAGLPSPRPALQYDVHQGDSLGPLRQRGGPLDAGTPSQEDSERLHAKSPRRRVDDEAQDERRPKRPRAQEISEHLRCFQHEPLITPPPSPLDANPPQLFPELDPSLYEVNATDWEMHCRARFHTGVPDFSQAMRVDAPSLRSIRRSYGFF